MVVPRCLVIIPDGNRRWARSHNLTRSIGHARGLVNCRTIAAEAFNLGVEHVVIWAASEANLKNRDSQEIANLFVLLKTELTYRSKQREKIGVHLCGILQKQNGRIDTEFEDLVRGVQQRTAHFDQHLTILFGYSGVTELVVAAEKAAKEGPPTEASIRKHLWTSHLPDVDLLIRTGVEGDPHWSDLLLPWQLRNTQLYFSEVYWPAFTVQHLQGAFEDYSARVRRAGA